jgi:hypothetical protein
MHIPSQYIHIGLTSALFKPTPGQDIVWIEQDDFKDLVVHAGIYDQTPKRAKLMQHRTFRLFGKPRISSQAVNMFDIYVEYRWEDQNDLSFDLKKLHPWGRTGQVCTDPIGFVCELSKAVMEAEQARHTALMKVALNEALELFE